MVSLHKDEDDRQVYTVQDVFLRRWLQYKYGGHRF